MRKFETYIKCPDCSEYLNGFEENGVKWYTCYNCDHFKTENEPEHYCVSCNTTFYKYNMVNCHKHCPVCNEYLGG